MTLERVVRGVAILIALAAVIDPAITTTRRTRPVIAVVAAEDADSTRARAVVRELEGAFTVVAAPFAGASGSVIVGDRVPADAAALARPVFAVMPDVERTVRLVEVHAPARSPLEASVPVDVVVHASDRSGRVVDIALEADGLVVDRVLHELHDPEEHVPARLAFLPVAEGPASLRVVAALAGDTAAADLAVDVRTSRWNVLFFDARPSWMSTFVRRAIERDPRFVVTSRVITSRDIGIAAGQPPAGLGDATAVERFDAIVVGAPEGLAERDVAGLEQYMRHRGGSVLLLLDQRAAGPYERLAAAGAWSVASTADSTVEFGGHGGALRVTQVAWPARLPAGATPVANSVASTGEARPVVWATSIGPGRLYVSGALDAWRYRDPAVSAFDRVWQDLIAQAADAAVAPIEIMIEQQALEPGEMTEVTVMLRDVALDPEVNRASIRAVMEGKTTEVVRLWPDGAAGWFTGRLRAPAQTGSYRLVVTSGEDEARAGFVVVADAARVQPAERDLLEAWVHTQGGSALAQSSLGRLTTRIDAAIEPRASRITWHPMRSAWWLLPFVIALGAEWWLRRRRGLA